jgi:hypothetical protein
MTIAHRGSTFWASYLLHHRAPTTRRLHFVGSLACLSGAWLAIALGSLVPLLAGLALGYLCAFSGHWWVERNQPLTFRHPIRAGICNWRLFGVECLGLCGIGGGFDAALERALRESPEALVAVFEAGGQ